MLLKIFDPSKPSPIAGYFETYKFNRNATYSKSKIKTSIGQFDPVFKLFLLVVSASTKCPIPFVFFLCKKYLFSCCGFYLFIACIS